MKQAYVYCFILMAFFLLFPSLNARAGDVLLKIPVITLESPPALDGSCDDWGHRQMTQVPMKPNADNLRSNVRKVSVLAGVHGQWFYLYAQWSDDSEDKIHKPFVWNSQEERYIRGPQREDRFSIQFAMEGDYTTQWFSGKEFKADMWHWKSSRTNPVHLAHDKMTIVSSTPMKKSYKTKAKNGKTIYLFRPSDQGDPIYFSKRYSFKEKELMPKYFFTPDPKGSITDVKAHGVWKSNIWHLEMKRKMNTGHNDDVVFQRGVPVKSGIGIFNASETTDHDISDVLVFEF